MKLRVDWCNYQAAKYACENWHYSKAMPAGASVKIGAWEDDKFIGCVIFSRGATPHIASPFGLQQTEVCELTRVALTNHSAPVSRILALGIRFLRKHCPCVKLVVSFADTEQNHHGGIYQATNWVYIGKHGEGERDGFKIHGKILHPKTVHSRGWRQSVQWLRQNIDPRASEVKAMGKHKYVYVLDETMRDTIQRLSKPYPKRPRAASVDSDAPCTQHGEGGANPTAALSNLEVCNAETE